MFQNKKNYSKKKKKTHNQNNRNPNPNYPNSNSGNRERRFFDGISRNDDPNLPDAATALRFLRAASSFAVEESPEALLYRLADDSSSFALSRSLSFLSPSAQSGRDLFKTGLLPILSLLCSSTSILRTPVHSQPRLAVLCKIHKVGEGGVSRVAAALISDGHLPTNDDRMTLATFCADLLVDVRPSVGLENLEELASLIVDASSSAPSSLFDSSPSDRPGVRLRTVLAAANLSVPGGRHDNDFSDYRSIEILPTAPEFASLAEPHLPLFSSATSDAAVLDRQFRLLREDMLGPARESQNDPRKLLRDLFYNARVQGVHSGVQRKNAANKVVVRSSEQCILFSVANPPRLWNAKKKEREDFWERSRRTLPRDALICLRRQNADGNWVPIRFGTIVRREVSEMAQDYPVIGIDFIFSSIDVADTLAEIAKVAHLPKTQLLVVASSLFAYRPVLKSLQSMTEITFSSEIVHGLPSKPPEYSSVLTVENSAPVDMREQVKSLDPSQRSALDAALQNRVALLQGPPGTGQ